MRRFIAGLLCSAVLVAIAIDVAESRRGGRFVTSFVSRGAVHAGTATVRTKTYGADVLTVQQLTDCLRRADQLDQDSTVLDAVRASLELKLSQVDSLQSQIESSRATLNRRSQSAVDAFNARVNRYNVAVEDARASQVQFNQRLEAHNTKATFYNVACAKSYYADDLEVAKRTVGLD